MLDDTHACIGRTEYAIDSQARTRADVFYLAEE
jgi:hypothetical protein